MSAVENPTPAVETPTPVAPPAPAPPPAPAAPTATKENRRETILHAAQNPKPHHAAAQPRTEQGQFTIGATKPPAPTPSAAPVIPRPAMPKSWNKELEAHWNTAPLELLNRFVQREEESAKGVEPLKAAQKQLDELLNEFKPYEQLIRSQNGTPSSVIRNLMNTANIFHTGQPAQKVQAVASLMQQFGIPLDHLQQIFSGNAPPQPALDPQVQMLTQQVQQLTNQQQAEKEARALAAIRKFQSDPANKHFDAVSDRLLALLQSPQAIGIEEGMGEDERLRLAYDAATRLDPEIYKQILAEQQAKETAEAQAKAAQQVEHARQAAVQVKGAPASAPAPKVDPKDRKALIQRIVSQR